MRDESTIDKFTSRDPSWQRAHDLVQKYFAIPAHVWRLFRHAWYGEAEPVDFLKVMSFARLNPLCLLYAAETYKPEEQATSESLEHAIHMLGIRLSSIVLAVNFATRKILASNPPPIWKDYTRELITLIEVGYHMGSRTPELGPEGGAMAGFSALIGEGVFLAENPRDYREYLRLKTQKRVPEREKRNYQARVLGCESYQIASLTIQALGFGSEMALGVALGSGKLRIDHRDVEREVLRWWAAHDWVVALREGRNYPSRPELRQFFSELIPPRQGAPKNPSLEVLYTEIARIKTHGSTWIWHLPKPGYQDTGKLLGI
ncbi:MAG: hypothetical protein D6719_06440 [Candidatus Dadabacteria bacterium]|nr:MAG: hypothetical protein D6719_06440 [Candidatus Dadabacteria bacterium]